MTVLQFGSSSGQSAREGRPFRGDSRLSSNLEHVAFRKMQISELFPSITWQESLDGVDFKPSWAQNKVSFLASVEQNVLKASGADELLQAFSGRECFGFVSKSGGLRARRGVQYPWKDGSVFQWIVGVWRVTFQAPAQRSDGYVRGEASRGAEPASRLITEEIFFVLRFPVSAFASKPSSGKACKGPNGSTFKRHLNKWPSRSPVKRKKTGLSLSCHSSQPLENS